jgi:streptogramin lyase
VAGGDDIPGTFTVSALAIELSSRGAILRIVSPPGVAVGNPSGIAVDVTGHVFVSNTDLGGYPVVELDATGAVVAKFALSDVLRGNLSSLAIDPSGNVWVVGGSEMNVVELVGAAHGPPFQPSHGPS